MKAASCTEGHVSLLQRGTCWKTSIGDPSLRNAPSGFQIGITFAFRGEGGGQQGLEGVTRAPRYLDTITHKAPGRKGKGEGVRPLLFFWDLGLGFLQKQSPWLCGAGNVHACAVTRPSWARVIEKAWKNQGLSAHALGERPRFHRRGCWEGTCAS